MRIRLVFAGLCLSIAGCTHIQLRNNTVNQAWTVGDIQQQQVLNNLAMFVFEPSSMPYFLVPNQGASGVNDQGNVSATPGFGRSGSGPFLFNALGFSFGAQRQASESYTTTPINDPRKLELMRCAYQQAVANCLGGEPSQYCPDCKSLQNNFYTGDPDGDIRAQANGKVTSECLKGKCWFQTGCKKDVPKHCPCTYVGSYCGTYVWVLPEGRNELSKLTLAILDYASNSPPTGLTKQVVYYIDERGIPTTSKLAVGTITANIGIKEDPISLLNTTTDQEATLLASIEAQIKDLQNRLQVPTIGEAEQKELLQELQTLNNKRDYLIDQIKAGGLKQTTSSVPSVGLPTSPALLLNQAINTLGGAPLGTGT